MQKQDIIQHLEDSFKSVATWIGQQSDDKFEFAPDQKWTSAEHLDHLYKTAKAVTKGMSVPKLMLWYKFGKRNRDLRSYEEVKSRYQERLLNIPDGMTSPIAVKAYDSEQKMERIKKFINSGDTLIRMVNRWSEKQLDTYLLPHPLMGRMPIREMLMWVDYHNYHHLDNLKKNYV